MTEETGNQRNQFRILVVDDEQGIRELLSLELGSAGYNVVTACNGLEGIEKIKTSYFDLVICDIKMPKMNGFEALRKIKEIDSNVSVIMTTADGADGTASQCFREGACDFINKPFDTEELRFKIRNALRNSSRTVKSCYRTK